MSKKCVGCGETLQFANKDLPGYVNEKVYEKAEICERCFKLKYYGETFVIDKKVDKDALIEKLNNNNKAVLYLIDTTCISKEVLMPLEKINTNVYVILTKRDLLPKSVKDYKLINYIKDITGKENVLVISSKKKHGIDEVYAKLVKDKIKEAYVVGYSNAGKSTLINSLLESKGKKASITVSSSPNTTIEEIKIKLEDLILIDTPGFISENSISNFIGISDYKKLLAKREIKPKIHTLKKDFMILLGDFIRIENNNSDTSLVFYINNDMPLEKMRSVRNDFLKDKERIIVKAGPSEDIVIEGIGFIKVNKEAKLDIYISNKNIISKRNKMI